MNVTIKRHAAAYKPPPDAIALLWGALEGVRHEQLSFVRAGDRITARARDQPAGVDNDEWRERCRRSALSIVADVCERTPALELDWFAIATED